MKPYGYRKASDEGKANGYLVAIKIAAILILSGVMVWFLYKDKIEAFISEHFPSNAAGTVNSENSQAGTPPLLIRLDLEEYTLEPADTSPDMTELSGGDKQVLSMNRHSNLQIIFDKQPESFSMKLYKDDTVAYSGQATEIPANTLPGDGNYLAVCEVNWKLIGGKARSFYSFALQVDFPPELKVSASEIDPGELLVICAENLNPDERLDIETDLDFKPTAYQYGSRRIALLPVSYYNEAEKVYQVKVVMGSEGLSYAIKIKDKEFTTQYMTIDTKVAAETRNDKSAKEIENKLAPLKPVSDPEPYWTGKFIQPVEGGRVNEADFGKRRYVNNSPTSYRHNGLDIGQDKGSPVMASNSGRVLIADKLIETGNTIIIEHGFGLKTWYYHMDELFVKTGDFVRQGDVIGKVGSTGFSTSPHLHFSATVNGVFINPISLINEGVPLLMPD